MSCSLPSLPGETVAHDRGGLRLRYAPSCAERPAPLAQGKRPRRLRLRPPRPAFNWRNMITCWINEGTRYRSLEAHRRLMRTDSSLWAQPGETPQLAERLFPGFNCLMTRQSTNSPRAINNRPQQQPALPELRQPVNERRAPIAASPHIGRRQPIDQPWQAREAILPSPRSRKCYVTPARGAQAP